MKEKRIWSCIGGDIYEKRWKCLFFWAIWKSGRVPA